MKLKSLDGLTAVPFKERVVPVPELEKDGEIVIREMSAARMADFQKYSSEDEEHSDEHLLIACMVDEDGNQIINHERAPHVATIFSIEVRDRLLSAVIELHPYLFDKKKASEQS